jgi:hypothetical protein
MAKSKRGSESPDEKKAQQAGREGKEQSSSRQPTSMSGHFSTSVMAVAKPLFESEPVSPGTIIEGLLKDHQEYGGGVVEDLLSGIGSAAGRRRSVEEWLLDVQSLYDRKQSDVVDGRMLIIGLSMLDSDIAAFLRRDEFLGNVVEEVKQSGTLDSLDELFTEDGLKKWHALEARLRLLPESVLSHSDDPSLIDRLGREAFAEALALRLRRIRSEAERSPDPEELRETNGDPEGMTPPGKGKAKESPAANPFMLHIHGPWGSGKSTLLGFMKKHLRKAVTEGNDKQPGSSAWIVVEFNAWRHQRLKMPWWSLMDAVFRTSVEQLEEDQKHKIARTVSRSERKWRFMLSKSHYLISVLLFVACIGLMVWAFYPRSGSEVTGLTRGPGMASEEVGEVSKTSRAVPPRTDQGSTTGVSPSTQARGPDRARVAGEWAKYMGALISLGIGIWTFVRGLCQSLIPGSEHAAEAFLTCSKDPLGRITKHFTELVGWIGQPVAIFIDDLDRCQAGYAVELLEGIQTLFKKAAVTYVVAADRRWLCSSYETVYESFKDTVSEPARPLGYLFLEKTFQLSVGLPRLAPAVQARYWHYLLHLQGSDRRVELKQELDRAREEVSQLKDERDILAELGRRSGDVGYGQAFRQAAVVRLADPDVEARTEHYLMDFGSFLEPNPRAMKRFVNAYSAQRALDILRGGASIDPGVLALWTIVVLRWPLLAAYLEGNPGIVSSIGHKPPVSEEVPEHLVSLFSDNDVEAVFAGKKGMTDVGARLDQVEMSGLSGLRTTDSMGVSEGAVA